MQMTLDIRQKPTKAKINEIFTSIQGEGRFAGTRTMFIRFAGCTLCCSYCDTKYAWDEGKEMSVNKIISMINNEPNAERICITGGEPLLQKEAVKEIVDRSPKPANIETNGVHNFSDLNCPCTVDIKMPSAKLDNYNLRQHYKARPMDEFKIVISDQKDFLRAVATIQSLRDAGLENTVWISPAYGQINPKKLASWILENPFIRGDVRMQLQIHKYIWNPKKRGV
ncbi:MAG: 7-carboxy-7-deazaguanine synthase QueE [Petrotogales bacterium]